MEPRPSTDEAQNKKWGFTDFVELVWTTVFCIKGMFSHCIVILLIVLAQ